METITGATAIIGMVNGINFIFEGEWKSFAKFAVALIVGVVFGYLNWFGIKGVEQGLAVALSSSGIYKISQIINQK